ncbi:hypothetical protein BDV93DRAFT_552345 [Ceratobasidium sp. AG-I]|nr:hypothetical protein BDV93DRAFT_552345 [Ceratobasidium sp. AG-I]
MGKWSPAYQDDLLHMKFRHLTYNAVDKLRKPKVEDGLMETNSEPRITHEQFIQALDVTDSFTQKIIEILVQEHAARRQNTRSNRGNAQGTVIHSTRTASALLELSEMCRGPQPSHPFRREFLFGSNGWDVDSDGTEDAGVEDFMHDVEHYTFSDRPSLGSRIGSSLRESHPGAPTLPQWRPLDMIFSPPSRTLDNPSPPPPAPSTRPNTLLSMMPGRSSSSLASARQSLVRRPASASGAAYFRPRHRAADFESQSQRLRDRARTRELLDYIHTPNGSTSEGASGAGSQVPPESFARRSSGPSDDESDPRPSGSLALPPAPVPAHAHAHSGPSHSTIRRVTSELSSLDRTIEAHRRELSAAREDFAARFRRGVSNLTPTLHRSPSPMAVGTQPRESLRAALWGAGPRDEEGLPTPRSMTPESGERGAAA